MRKLYLVIATLLVQGCVNPQANNKNELAFEVLGFSQGKMREEASGWVVYEPGQEMQFAINGQCVFNQRVIPCMWHGFILEYDSHGENIGLNCESVSNAPRDIGNPVKIEKLGSTQHEFTIPLNGEERVFINPQYISGGLPGTSLVSYTKCSVKSREVLEFQQIFHFPATNIEL